MKISYVLTASLLLLWHAAFAQSNNSNMENKKILVAFFSRTGENYSVGQIEKGNTHIVAEMIASEMGADLFQIEPTVAYPNNYNECIDVAKRELNDKARPAIKSKGSVAEYDVIFLGYPNWWGDMPMAVYTFIESHNWQGKTVVPFCTHEGSGLSGTENKVKSACKGATVLSGFALRGATAQNEQAEALQRVKKWLNTLIQK